jgi:hypothetical protein
MVELKAFVRQDDTTTIICPTCKMTRNVSVGAYRNKQHLLKIRCTCGNRFTVHIDFRDYYRKVTKLPGLYRIIKPAGKGSGSVQIRNISLSGIGFTVEGLHMLEPEQTLELEFQLNDKKQTSLVKQVRICTVDKNYIGCEFIHQEALEKALGFYLRA